MKPPTPSNAMFEFWEGGTNSCFFVCKNCQGYVGTYWPGEEIRWWANHCLCDRCRVGAHYWARTQGMKRAPSLQGHNVYRKP